MRDCGEYILSVKKRQHTLVVQLIIMLGCRLKNFDPDNDDESLSNLETHCDGKEDLQPLHRAGLLPADSLEYMESGRRRKASLTLTLTFIGTSSTQSRSSATLTSCLSSSTRATGRPRLPARQHEQRRRVGADDALPEGGGPQVPGGVASWAGGRGVGGPPGLEEAQHGAA